MKKLNKTTYIRNQNGFFQMVPIRLLNDERLSPYAKFIMITIISNNDDWVINKNEILSRTDFPKNKFYQGWDELKKYGYIDVIRRQGYWQYLINENISKSTGGTCESNETNEAGNDNLSKPTGRTSKGSTVIYTNNNIHQTLIPKTKVPKEHSQTDDNSSDKRKNFVISNEVPSPVLRFDSLLNELTEEDALEYGLEPDTIDLSLVLDI